MFKIVVMMLSFVAFSTAWACSCAPGTLPLSPEDAVMNYVKDKFGVTEESKVEMETMKYYPSLLERLAIADMRGTSCVGQDERGNEYFHCASSFKGDLQVKLLSLNCEVLLKVKTTKKSSKVKLLSSSCLK